MPETESILIRQVKTWKIIIPIVLGLGVIIWLFYNEFDIKSFSKIRFTWQTILFIILAFIMMVVRDFGYMIRLKILSGNQFSWKNTFNINFLWEFTSAITPSAVGGTTFAVIYVHKEGKMSVGKSTALVLSTAFLDELYFFLMFPLMVILIGPNTLFTLQNNFSTISDFENRYFYFAVIGYILKASFIILIFYGLFIKPQRIRQLLLWFFHFRILKRWYSKAKKTGNDIVESSFILKKQNFVFWIKSFLATFFSWTARYLVLNFLLLSLYASINPHAIAGLSFSEHLLIFARQLVMWIMMLVLPSPGGSGFSEIIFSDYMADFMPIAFTGLMALLWRIITYYPYLIIGALMVPKWITRHFSFKK